MEKEAQVSEIPISKIRDFPDHPYKVRDDDSMTELIASIKDCGLIQPVIVRPVEDGMYEMVSGHRRKRAFELAGYDKIPASVRELSKDEAILTMVDSNLQREVILPSEKAKAYKMRLEAMKRQGQRTDLTSNPVGGKLKGKESAEVIGELSGDSQTQVRRFIRLNELIPEMLNLVDEGKIAMRPAVEISYLPKEAQKNLYDATRYNECTPSHDQTIRMRKAMNEGRLTKEVIETIMDEEKPNQRVKSPFRDERIGQIMTSKSPVRSAEDVDEQALSYAEIKALATGNPYIKEKMDLDIDVSRLKLLKQNHLSQRYSLEDKILKFYPVEIKRLENRIEGYTEDIQRVKNNTFLNSDGFSPMIIDGISYAEKKDAARRFLLPARQ